MEKKADESWENCIKKQNKTKKQQQQQKKKQICKDLRVHLIGLTTISATDGFLNVQLLGAVNEWCGHCMALTGAVRQTMFSLTAAVMIDR